MFITMYKAKPTRSFYHLHEHTYTYMYNHDKLTNIANYYFLKLSCTDQCINLAIMIGDK